MSKNNIDFRFFTDNFNIISKGKDDKGNDVMRVGGIAVTSDLDSQNEILVVDGCNIERLNGAICNWNHQLLKDPSSAVGVVTKAEKRTNGIYVECDLFSDHQKSKDIYELTKRLEKANTKQKMAFSIEGRVIERDELDPRRVTKSVLSGVALTAQPINRATFAQIIKGETDGLEEPQFEKSESGNLIDLKDSEGNRITLDSNFNIKIEKSMTTESAAPLRKESLDKEIKVQEFEDEDEENIKKEKNIKKSFFIDRESFNFTSKLEKSQIYDLLIKASTNMSYDNLKRLYQTIEVLQKTKGDTMSELTPEKLEKALTFLNNIAEQSEKLEKSSHMKKNEEEEEEKKEAPQNEDKEEEMKKEFVEKSSDMKKSEEQSLEEKIQKAEAELISLRELKKAEEEKSISKPNLNQEIIKGLLSDIESTIDKKISTVTELVKGLSSENESIKKILETKEEELKKSEDKYQELASKSQSPRSITSSSYIIKGDTEETKGTYVLDSRNEMHRKLILEKGDQLINWNLVQSGDVFEKSFAEDLNNFQFGNPATQSMMQKFKDNKISII